MNTVGERLREERERLGLSQTALGELVGVRKRAQINYEQGERSPDAEYLVALAKAGGDVLYVITNERKNTSPSAFHPGKLRQVIEGVEIALDGKRLRLTPTKKAELITLLYEHFSGPEQVERGTVDRFLRLVA